MEGCLYLGFFLLFAVTVITPALPVAVLIVHILVLIMAARRQVAPRSWFIWVLAFLCLSAVPFAWPAEGYTRTTWYTGSVIETTELQVRLTRFWLGQLVLSLSGTVGWLVVLRRAPRLPREGGAASREGH